MVIDEDEEKEEKKVIIGEFNGGSPSLKKKLQIFNEDDEASSPFKATKVIKDYTD
jgi:hypothetical protein